VAALNLKNTMDAIASTLTAAGQKRVYAYPADSIQTPAIVVAYPSEPIEFDQYMGRGSDRAVFDVYAVVGKANTLGARNALSDFISGSAAGIKEALDGDLGGAVQTARVQTLTIEAVKVGEVEYLAAKFAVEVYT
jgi:hypothetical protein